MTKIVHGLLIAAIATSSLIAGKISGAGASFPAPLYYDWAYSYQKDTKTRVNYQSIGSGGGIKQISKRVVNFGASDKPLATKKLAKKKLLQFPAVIGSIVVALNVPGVKDEELKLKNSVVADIFAGKITKWNDAAIPQSMDTPADLLLEREEFMQFLILCISLLPETWAKVFSLKSIEELSSKEICKELKITPSNLWTIIHRAKLQLRDCLEKRWQDK